MLLFVYGTLKRGGRNHPYLAKERFVGEACTVPGWAMYDVGGYPGLVAAPDSDRSVPGELWDVSDETLVRLDQLEGVDAGIFARVSIPLRNGPAAQAQAYHYILGIVGRRQVDGPWPCSGALPRRP